MDDVTPENELGVTAQRLMTDAATKIMLGFLVVFITAIVQGSRYGFGKRDYLFLAFGSVVSFISAFAYGLVGVMRAYGHPKQLWMYPAIWSGWLPYAFIVYLVFYRGLWALVQLFSAFSVSSLLGALAFTVIGFFTIRHLQTITDIVRYVRQALEA
jgi:hypothetical protein